VTSARPATPPLTLGRAWDLLASIETLITTHCPHVRDITVAGDARRFEPLVFDPCLVGRAADPPACIGALCVAPGVQAVLERTARRVLLTIHNATVDVRIAGDDEYGTVLVNATGSAEHLQALASRRPMTTLHAREEDVYARLGLPWIPPELRHDTGEIEAAAAGRLPALVERRHIRGDLHMHSTYSDGQDSMERMIAAAAALGYEYIAITDHSERAAASRTLREDQVAEQREELEGLRDAYPGLTILHGIEVDILPDGRLDFRDRLLEHFDIVLASLHDSALQDGEALTRRCLQAIHHPLVNVITHPSNQLVGRRAGYPLDYERIYEAAADTGTALEIDGAPSHLDLDGDRARAAVLSGVTTTIDSDCHRCGALDRQMTFGIGTARRGWVEPAHVLNCRPIEEVRAFVEAKRRRKSAC
jgi:DNA polymerase (family 10)